LQALSEQGKDYSWHKPKRCPKCGGRRLWWHGYTLRSFHGYANKVWIKKCICADCKSVHTMRPHTHWQGFQYSKSIILGCMVGKIKMNRWQDAIRRQNQQYWFKGLILQSVRYANTNFPTTEVLKLVILTAIIPVSHSIQYANLRL
jgi:hypothetical protein